MFQRLIEGVEIAFGPPMPAPPPAGLCYSRAFFPKEVMWPRGSLRGVCCDGLRSPARGS